MTSGDSPLFAVVGATGQQGGATVRALLAAGARVRGLTRDPGSRGGQALARQGVEVVRGDAGDPASLRAAFDGADAAFVMTTPFGPGGAEQETEQGIALVDAVRDAGVPRLVLNSVGGAERGTGIPHFESKRRVEEHVERLGLTATVVGDQLQGPFGRLAGTGRTLAEAGATQQEVVHQLALWLGVVVAAVPVVALLLAWLPGQHR